MRDPNRIPKMIELFQAYWERAPDLRLGQIIGNFTPTIRTDGGLYVGPGSIYNVEDDVVYAAMLKHFFECYGWKKGIPKPGEILFVGPADDWCGGWATVKETGRWGKGNMWVRMAELPSCQFGWNQLKAEQEKLRGYYGEQRARYDER